VSTLVSHDMGLATGLTAGCADPAAVWDAAVMGWLELTPRLQMPDVG
jgi:hypothetical protein